MKNPFKKQSLITTAVTVLGAGAGSAVADWLLDRFGIIDENWEKTTVNAVKAVVGAVGGSMIPVKGTLSLVAKSACDGIATVAAHNIVADLLPANENIPTNTESGAAGLPYGTIGASRGYRMGQGKKFKRVNGVGSASFMQA